MTPRHSHTPNSLQRRRSRNATAFALEYIAGRVRNTLVAETWFRSIEWSHDDAAKRLSPRVPRRPAAMTHSPLKQNASHDDSSQEDANNRANFFKGVEVW